jgi:hypothetical protein
MKLRLEGALCCLGIILLGSTGCIDASAAAEGSFDRTLSVSGSVDLDVTTGSGRISVRTGSDHAVRISGLIRAHDDFRARAEEKVRYLESNPPIEQTGNIVRIGHISDERYRNNVSISYELVVPPDTRLRARTGSGAQNIDGVKGPADVSTGSGSILVANVASPVTAKTGSGRIELDSIGGRVEANTGSGSIRVVHVSGSFSGRTGSGDITMDQSAPGDVDVSTGSGSIEVSNLRGSLVARTGSGHITANGEPAGEWNVHSSSGGITIRLDPNASFDLQAHSSSGGITVNHPLTVTGTVSRRDMKGKVRGGGPLLNLSTSSGRIVVQ